VADDVVLNKTSTTERFLRRVQEEYDGDPANLHDDITKQDAIVLNLQRACQAAIDLAMHLVRKHELGMPEESREAFALLEEHEYLDPDLSRRLMRMVRFRNVATHEYQTLNLDTVQSIVEDHLADFTQFTEWAPTDRRMRPSVMPASSRCAGAIETWLMVAGCSISDSTPPSDSASAKTSMARSNSSTSIWSSSAKKETMPP